MSKFLWAPGYQIPIAAERFGQRYEELSRKYGTVTAERVLEDARPPDSPLHDAFEWDDQRAAEAHRLNRAGYLLRALRVIDEAVTEGQPPRRYLIAVQPISDVSVRYKEYLPLHVALADPVRRDEVLQRALHELEVFQAKYQSLQELNAIFAALRRMRRRRPRTP